MATYFRILSISILLMTLTIAVRTITIKTKLFALAELVSVCLLLLAAISSHSFSEMTRMNLEKSVVHGFYHKLLIPRPTDLSRLNETRLLLQKSTADMLMLR